MKPSKTYEFHPIADCWALIEGDEFKALVRDIKQRGVIEPIWLFEGKILDGRNRYRASLAAGVVCHTRQYEGDDPAGFAVSINDLRRHQTVSQRALAAARLATLAQGARRDLAPSANVQKVSQAEAAQMLRVSTRAVASAKQILKSARLEIIEAVERGTVTVHAAEKLLTMTPEEVKKIHTGKSELKKLPRFASPNSPRDMGWFTPAHVIEAVRDFYDGHIDTDPASCKEAQVIVKAKIYFDVTTDGLRQPWRGNVFLNPPYSKQILDNFINTLIAKGEAQEYEQAIVLIPNSTESLASQKMLAHCAAVCFMQKRLRFVHIAKGAATSPIDGSCLFYLGNNPPGFKKAFGQYGVTLTA